MEFWGTEVAPGEPNVCYPGDEMYCHVSQAALGPSQSGKSERVVVRVETGGKDVILGTLSSGKCDQMALDLIFDREFKLSHSSTSSSVYFCGYKTEKGEAEDFDSEGEDESEEESEEEPEAVPMKANGGAKVVAAGKVAVETDKKGSKSPSKKHFVDMEAEEGEESDEDYEDESIQMNSTVTDFGYDDSDGEDDSDFEDDDDVIDDDSDEMSEDDSDEEEESEDEVMASPEVSKKRSFKQSSAKSPTSSKKARVDTPAKPGLAPSPGKNAEKAAAKAASVPSTPGKATPATPGGKKVKDGKEAKKDQKTPPKDASVKTPKAGSKTPAAKPEATPSPTSGKKSLGLHRCDACNRSFATEAGASQHMTAKHGTPTTGK